MIELHQVVELGSAMEGCEEKQGSKYHIHTTACCATPYTYFWLWQHHGRAEGESGLTSMQLELVGPPVNCQAYVSQNL